LATNYKTQGGMYTMTIKVQLCFHYKTNLNLYSRLMKYTRILATGIKHKKDI